MYRHIQYILKRAIQGGNVELTVSGQENIPAQGGFMLYGNHQGMFDVLAIAATWYILKRAIQGGNVELTVSGQENIPAQGGFMLYGNHQGMFDVLAIAATCDRPIGAVLKKELYDIPFLHQIALCTRSYPMDREDVRQSLKVIQAVTEEVKNGRSYLIFPEQCGADRVRPGEYSGPGRLYALWQPPGHV